MKLSVLILFCFASFAAAAQTVISGRVVDASGDGLPLANIMLAGTYDGTSSSPDGSFSFETLESGEHTLIVSFIGYREHRQSVTLRGIPLQIVVSLTEEISELNAVTISAGSFTASDASRRTVFRPIDIATTAGATADIAGALNTLPGTQKVGESGRLFVRGGDGNETRTFIDGMVVLDAYSPSAPNTPTRGRFLPFMFKGTSFSTGGYSAEYGQALSSALVLDSKDKSETTRTDIGILSVGGDVSHTHAWKSGSAAAKLQYTDIRPYYDLVSQRIDWHTPPVALEGIGAFRQEICRNGGIVKVFANISSTTFSLYQRHIDDPAAATLYAMENNYRYINAFVRVPAGENWMVRGGMSFTNIDDDVTIDGLKVRTGDKGLHSKIVAEGSVREGLELKAGAELLTRSYSHINSALNEVIRVAFAEMDLYATHRFVSRIGGRAEYNSLQSSTTVDPRISLAYKTGGNSQVSVAFGNYRQSPAKEILLHNKHLHSEQALHYIANYQVIDDDRTFQLEAYHKMYQDLIRMSAGGYDNSGEGYARGIEFFWRDKRTFRRVDYWISYSLLDTKRSYLNFPSSATPAFASRHNFSLVTKYFITSLKSQLGATLSYASGRPYHNPNSNGFNTGRTPAYRDVSINWSYLPKPWLIVYLSCTNVTGYDNIFGYEYSSKMNEDGYYNRRPVRQPAPRFLFAGIFITLSKDKSVNQLPEL